MLKEKGIGQESQPAMTGKTGGRIFKGKEITHLFEYDLLQAAK